MPSFKTTIFAVAAAFVAVARTDYIIDPDSVPLSQRQGWCKSEKNICPAICTEVSDGTTEVNECDPETLTYGCICGDGKQPNVSEYSLSLPFFVCQEFGNQCVAACNRDNECSYNCREDNPCGASNPKKYTTTSAESSTKGAKPTKGASSTEDSETIFTSVVDSDDDEDSDDSSSSSSSDDKPGAAAALDAGRVWGLPIVLGSFFIGFALL